MKIERLDFRELIIGNHMEAVAGTKIFIPSHNPKTSEPPPPPPPPVFNEEEMKSAEREGYKKGFVEGEKEGRRQAENAQTEINRQLTGMLEQFVASVSPIFDHYRQMAMQVEKDVPQVALAIARKVASESLDQNAQTIISDMAIQCCEGMINEPELTIIAHESMADTLERQLQEMAVRLSAATHIVIMRDPDMPRSDCRIEWHNGSMERITARLWQQVEKAVGNMAAIATREATEQMETLKTQISEANEPSSNKE